MELEGYSRPTCDKLCASSNYVSIVVGVIHKLDRRQVLLTAPSISRDEIFFLSLEFGAKFQTEVPLFLKIPEFHYNTVWARWKEASVPTKPSSISPGVLIQYRLVTDRRRDGQTEGHMKTANIALTD